ncbi:DUF421 domain-containing protein [Vallitalea guaymasensis]|uniref:DUF421 domain-containing protein n=1 Tax=Vallitalea guaymasensis TaxID=1185412 RepID=A0A8J8ME66_9FIRM|nr:DUF421 domain-containing protein [Vallitalea guaymasensis]QUH31281.1 DUF421 domain-containing protein [Vallitalea guaymasensis]
MNESIVVIVRGVIGFFSLLIFTRLLGKQQVSQLTLFEYILGITIGSMASTLTTDLSSAAWPHWVGLVVWATLVYLVQVLTLKFPVISEYINGKPRVLIANGKILEKNLKKLRYNLFELLEQLRMNNIFDINQVEFAVLETNGKLTVLKKSQFQSLTPKDMNLSTDYMGLSTELIYNGVVMEHNLEKIDLDEKWLDSQLKTRGIKNPLEVYLAVINTSGELYIDLYKDHMDDKSL